MEAHLFEAVENNVFGTRNWREAAADMAVEDFVLVSSDKAVRPANVMGATKRVPNCVPGGRRGGRGPRSWRCASATCWARTAA